MQACSLADELKYLGFKYATTAGISISIEDLRVPFIKNLMLEKANQEIIKIAERVEPLIPRPPIGSSEIVIRRWT